MKIVCISDTHTYHHNLILPKGDILIHAGDFCSSGKQNQVRNFAQWFQSQNFSHKICIPGNHDIFCELDVMYAKKMFEFTNTHYLFDKEVVIDGIKFYGSPWQPEFFNWAFNLPRKGQQLKDVWDQIPIDTNILITHGPPHGILDWSIHSNEHVGCELLASKITELKQLKAHIFGHIHYCHGTQEKDGVKYVNASSCTENYKPTNQPIIIDL